MLNRRTLLGSIAATTLVTPRLSFAQAAFAPSSITMVCPFATGSGADVWSRFFANKLKDVSGITTIVENKVGAAGLIASQYVAKAKPDGHIVYMIPGANVLGSAPHLFKQLPFDPVNDFTHVTTVAKTVLVLLVPANSPYKTTADLVADLKAKGDKASYASVSNTSLAISELFKAAFDLQTVEVKFPSFAPVINEMNSGNISFVFLDGAQSLGHLESGRMRALFQTTAERTSGLPDIPGARESGVKDMDIALWWSVHLPKDTPQAIVSQYEKWFAAIMASEDTKKFLATSGTSPFPGNPKQLKALLEEEIKKWGVYARLAKIVPQ